MARLQAEPPTAEEVATLVRLEELQWENEQQENGWWHDLLVRGKAAWLPGLLPALVCRLFA